MKNVFMNICTYFCISMNIKLWLLKRPCEFKHINSIDNYETLIKRLKSINME